MGCHQADAAKPAAGGPRVNDRRVLGIFRVLRSGAPWHEPPEAFGPYTACYNRFAHPAEGQSQRSDLLQRLSLRGRNRVERFSSRIKQSRASRRATTGLPPTTSPSFKLASIRL